MTFRRSGSGDSEPRQQTGNSDFYDFYDEPPPEILQFEDFIFVQGARYFENLHLKSQHGVEFLAVAESNAIGRIRFHRDPY